MVNLLTRLIDAFCTGCKIYHEVLVLTGVVLDVRAMGDDHLSDSFIPQPLFPPLDFHGINPIDPGQKVVDYSIVNYSPVMLNQAADKKVVETC